jgi:polar amino acid transport system substrate-binding protein
MFKRIIIIGILLLSLGHKHKGKTTKILKQDAKEFIISTGQWAPYTSKDVPYGGLCNHIISLAMDRINKKYSFKYFPWKRASKTLENGAVDGSSCWIKNQERLKKYLYTSPLIVQKTYFIYFKSRKPIWNKYKDLNKYRVLDTRGYSYGEAYDQAKKEGLFDTNIINSDIQGIKMILANRADMIAIEGSVYRELIKKAVKNGDVTQKDADNLAVHPKIINQKLLHLILSKKRENEWKEFIPKFNKALGELIREGKIKELEEKNLKGFYSL